MKESGKVQSFYFSYFLYFKTMVITKVVIKIEIKNRTSSFGDIWGGKEVAVL